MKKLSKITYLLLMAVFMLTFSETAFSFENNQDENKDEAKVTVYYFHATHRCATCNAVEAVTKDAISTFPEKDVIFISLNREEDKNNALVEKYKISGQTLLVVRGDKTEDLTTKAFMFARNSPEKLKKKIKATIDNMLE